MGSITVGVLALQGAFIEHVQLLKIAVEQGSSASQWEFIEVRTPQELERCDALILPGGESTTISLVAARSNMLEPLRDFVKYDCHLSTCKFLVLVSDILLCLGSTANQHGAPVPVSFYSPNLPIKPRKVARSLSEVWMSG